MRPFIVMAALMASAPAAALAQPAETPAPAAAIEAPVPAEAPAYIEPTNALERAFIAAVENAELRAAFRRQFLESQVVLALSSADPSAPPRQINLPTGARACLIFTSPARAAAIMGDDAPYVVLSGREALERLRGANVVININLRPFLTLDSDSVASFLAIPQTPAAAPEPSVEEEEAPAVDESSAGPTQ